MGLPTFHVDKPTTRVPIGGDGTCAVHHECIKNIKDDVVQNTKRIGEVAEGQHQLALKMAKWGGAIATLVVLMPIIVAIVKELIK
jgi:hypothetical protein